jgi:phosphoribosyl 1,2-cyclic phosphate phosphodiesterase
LTDLARITVLGSGTSHGVPLIGCECATCNSRDPRDQRMRPSIYIELSNGKNLLVDTSTDLRQQALRFNLKSVDAVLYTHSHADHIMGLDELRRFNVLKNGPIVCYADARTWEGLRRTFFYIFENRSQQGGGIPKLETKEIVGPFLVEGTAVMPVPLLHGSTPILGFRLGSFAYLTDCNKIPETSWPLLEGLDTLILDALRHRSHSTHFSISEALDVVVRLKPNRTYLTHICHELPHSETTASLPTDVGLAYDGLSFNVNMSNS